MPESVKPSKYFDELTKSLPTTTTIDVTEYARPTGVADLDALDSMALAAVNNLGVDSSATTFSGTWLVTEQYLDLEYIRKTHGGRTTGLRSDVTLSSMAVSADTDSSVFFKVRPVVRRYLLTETFTSSGYEQLQTFEHLQVSSDLQGNTFDGMTSSTIGIRGKIVTKEKYLKREQYDPSNPLHIESDYIYPWFYSYDVGNPAMLIPFFASNHWEQSLFAPGEVAYAVAQETSESAERYDAVFSDATTDYSVYPAWWLATNAESALEAGGGVDNFLNATLYSPVKGIPAVSFTRNFTSWTGEISAGELLQEAWGRWIDHPIQVGLRSPGLNVWDIGTNSYSLDCADLRANMPSDPETEVAINSWIAALPHEYQIVRHA